MRNLGVYADEPLGEFGSVIYRKPAGVESTVNSFHAETYTRGGYWAPTIHDISIPQAMRGKGIGSAVVSAWEKYMLNARNPVVLVADVNKDAMGFWRKMGYTPDGNYPEYGFGSIWRKNLEAP